MKVTAGKSKEVGEAFIVNQDIDRSNFSKQRNQKEQ